MRAKTCFPAREKLHRMRLNVVVRVVPMVLVLLVGRCISSILNRSSCSAISHLKQRQRRSASVIRNTSPDKMLAVCRNGSATVTPAAVLHQRQRDDSPASMAAAYDHILVVPAVKLLRSAGRVIREHQVRMQRHWAARADHRVNRRQCVRAASMKPKCGVQFINRERVRAKDTVRLRRWAALIL